MSTPQPSTSAAAGRGGRGKRPGKGRGSKNINGSKSKVGGGEPIMSPTSNNIDNKTNNGGRGRGGNGRRRPRKGAAGRGGKSSLGDEALTKAGAYNTEEKVTLPREENHYHNNNPIEELKVQPMSDQVSFVLLLTWGAVVLISYILTHDIT